MHSYNTNLLSDSECNYTNFAHPHLWTEVTKPINYIWLYIYNTSLLSYNECNYYTNFDQTTSLDRSYKTNKCSYLKHYTLPKHHITNNKESKIKNGITFTY